MTDWPTLRRHTQARIGLGRAGASLPTRALLDFQLAHAQARDAVWREWDMDAFRRALDANKITHATVQSRATTRDIYLQRPDLGRVLDDSARAQLNALRSANGCDLALVVSDGLSAFALESHGIECVRAIYDAAHAQGLSVSPVVLVERGRVAISDLIGEALGARTVAIVLGERPGLSAADSLGIYMTYAPRPGTTDAQRNCISNVRLPEGLAPQTAATSLVALVKCAIFQGRSGVALQAGLVP